MNIGVVVVSQDTQVALCKFTRDWGRPRRFGREDVRYLREFAAQLEADLPQDKGLFTKPFLAEELKAFHSEWRNSIQFSEPRTSIEGNLGLLLNRLFSQFVQEQPQRKFAPRKSQAIAEAKKELTIGLRSRARAPKSVEVVSHQEIEGQFGTHKFDLVVRNGRPLICLDAISVEEEVASFDEHVRATGWDLIGVREAHSRAQLGVMLVDASRKQIDETRRMFKRLNTSVFKRSELSEWADKALTKIAGRPRQLSLATRESHSHSPPRS